MARPTLTRHRKFLRLARALRDEVVARGSLEFIWDSAYEAGDDYLGDADDVEAAAHWKGEPGALTKALLDAGFIDEIEDRQGQYRIHDLWHHAPDYVRKRRKREAERRAKTDPAAANGGQCPVNDRSVTEQRQPSPDCSAEVARTPAPAPAPKEQNLSSKPKSGFDPEAGALEPVLEVRKSVSTQPTQPSHEAEKLAALLKDCIRRNKPDFRVTPAQLRKWAVTADRMLRLDKRSYESVAVLIEWCQNDGFERANVLSMDKLRTRFD